MQFELQGIPVIHTHDSQNHSKYSFSCNIWAMERVMITFLAGFSVWTFFLASKPSQANHQSPPAAKVRWIQSGASSQHRSLFGNSTALVASFWTSACELRWPLGQWIKNSPHLQGTIDRDENQFIGQVEVESKLLRLKTVNVPGTCCIQFEAFLLAPEAELAKSWRAPYGKLFDCTFWPSLCAAIVLQDVKMPLSMIVVL